METSSPPLVELFEELSRACADGVAGLPADELLRLVTDAGTLHRALDAIRVRLAGELAAQSGPEALARRAGHASAASFLAELWQISPAEAARLCDVGVAVRPRLARDGSLLPARFRDRLDEDGVEPRDQIRRQRRSLTLIPQPDGMVRLVWDMPPETAGLVRAGIDALVGEQLRAARDQVADSLGTDGVADADDRTMPQRRADAAEELLRHAIGCDRPGGDRPVVTVVVRMTLDQLLDGLGSAQIDGVDARISAATARILAAEANIVPAVLGGTREILDLGRARRLFSPAQRQALAEQYGGCAFPGCGHPPSYTEAHHLQWWSHDGPTDLANGIPLCSFHHHRIHDDGWEIDVRDRVPYFIPPPWVDTDQAPRRGGNALVSVE